MSAVSLRAAWWAQSYGYAPTLEGAQSCMRKHGTWAFMAFIQRCARLAERSGFRPAGDQARFDSLVRREALADTLRRFPA